MVFVRNLEDDPLWIEVKGSEPLVVLTSFALPSASATGGGGGGLTGQVVTLPKKQCAVPSSHMVTVS